MAWNYMKHDIFISYRRDGGFETARYLYDHLTWDGYRVTFDLDSLRAGRFDDALLERIDECTDFVIVLNKGCLDRTLNPNFPRENDWMRRELGYAIKKKKNVIPILLGGFEFPAALPEDIDEVRFINAPPYSREYIDSFYEKLKVFLRTSPPSNGANGKAAGGQTVRCPICGKQTVETETFTCRQCGRSGICLEHQTQKGYRCKECEGFRKKGNVFTLLLFIVSMVCVVCEMETAAIVLFGCSLVAFVVPRMKIRRGGATQLPNKPVSKKM